MSSTPASALPTLRKSETKAEPKSVRQQPSSEVASEFISAFDSAIDQVDEILAAIARGEQLSDVEISILEQSGLPRKRDQERQASRMRAVLRHQEAAGTKEERAVLEAAIDEALRAEAEQAPELERQIAELTRQRELLAKAPEEAKRRLKTMQDAVEALRSLRLMPGQVIDQNRNLHRLMRDTTRAIDYLEREVKRCDVILQAADNGVPEIFDLSSGIYRNVTPELVESASKQRQSALEDIVAQKRLYEALQLDVEKILNRYVK